MRKIEKYILIYLIVVHFINNRNILEKSKNKINQSFLITKDKRSKISDLTDKYALFLKMYQTEEYATNAMKLYGTLFDNFIEVIQDFVIERG